MQPTEKSNYDNRIDILRAVSFLLVALPHFSIPTWTQNIQTRHGILDEVFLAIIKTGWFGVPMFLFISGFSLALGKTNSVMMFDFKQFFLNRFLRIAPIWILCVLMLAFTNSLPGEKVISLILFQLQDIPTSTPFRIAWSIQLEIACYFLFPVFLLSIKKKNDVAAFFAFFLMVRIGLFFLDSQRAFFFQYSTVFGGATIFLSGIWTATLKPMVRGWRSRLVLSLGVAMFVWLSVFITQRGGYEGPRGHLIHWTFIFLPEIFSLIVFLIMRGMIVSPGPSALRDVPAVLAFSGKIISAVMTHIGKVSYSGYMFSLFVLDFTSRVLVFFPPAGWMALISAFLLYLAVLVMFSTVSYHAIERPFLNLRRTYAWKTQGAPDGKL
jgi:peptidoglycan/LPS O-acetylase OafA/YrhL